MKFGQKLKSYSHPKWANNNLRYNELKAFIKSETTGKVTRAIPIPGQATNGQLQKGSERDLYSLLVYELEGIDDFCNVKSNDVHCALDRCSRFLERSLPQETEPIALRTSTRLLRKLYRLEDATLKVGEDIQAMSRFIGAQKIGFRKLLKKYQKWSGSPRLASHFQINLDRSPWLGNPTDPMKTQLSRYTQLLEAIRSPLDSMVMARPSESLRPDVDYPEELLLLNGASGVTAQADAAFESSHLGHDEGRAAYWIHDDNLVQAQVAIQRAFIGRRPSSSNAIGPRSQTSIPGNDTRSATDYQNLWAGTVLFDDPQSFAKSQLEPLQSPEHMPGSGLQCDGHVLVAVQSDNVWPGTKASLYVVESEKLIACALNGNRIVMKRKNFRDLIQASASHCEEVPATSPTSADLDPPTKWFKDNPNIQRLADIAYKRSRFTGLENTKSIGMWAILDTDVAFGRDMFGDSLRLDGVFKGHRRFPHAILQVRWEGQEVPKFIKELDEGHIAKRIPAFTVDAHALAMLYTDMPEPPWFATLAEDIRSVPSENTVTGKPSSGPRSQKTPEASTPATERRSSVFSATQDQNSSTSGIGSFRVGSSHALKVERKRLIRAGKQKTQSPPEMDLSDQLHFWNEIDDEQQAANELFTIDVYPEDDILFKTFFAIRRHCQNAWNTLLRRPRESLEEDQRPLDPEGSVSSSSTEESMLGSSPRFYGTLTKKGRRIKRELAATAARDRWLFHSSWIMFVMSVLFLLMSLVLESTGRRRYTAQTNAAAFVGVIASVLLAILAMVASLWRGRRKLGWVWTAIAVVGFLVIAVVNGILVFVMLRRGAIARGNHVK